MSSSPSNGKATAVSTFIALTLIASVFSLISSAIPTISITGAFAQAENNVNNSAANGGTTNSYSTTLPGFNFSSQPVWHEKVTTTSATRINQTHSIVAFNGNGTITVPESGQTIKMTNNGTAYISTVPGDPTTVSTYGREYVFSSVSNDKNSYHI